MQRTCFLFWMEAPWSHEEIFPIQVAVKVSFRFKVYAFLFTFRII